MRIEFTGGWLEFEPKLNESATQYPDWLPDAAENHPEWAAAKAPPPPTTKHVVSLKDVIYGDVFFVVGRLSTLYRAITTLNLNPAYQCFGSSLIHDSQSFEYGKDTQVVVIHNTEMGK